MQGQPGMAVLGQVMDARERLLEVSEAAVSGAMSTRLQEEPVWSTRAVEAGVGPPMVAQAA